MSFGSSMASSSSSSSKVAWLWCLEALADLKPVNATLLCDFARRVSELSNQSSETARERASLSCLEKWLSLNSSSDAGVASLTSGIGFEGSDGVTGKRNCEEVLRLVLNKAEISELLKQEVHQFILHKRESMGGCALKQMKDAILDGTLPISTPVLKRKYLAIGSESRSIGHAIEGSSTEPAMINYDGDNKSGTPAENSVHVLSRKNGEELLQEGQEWNKSKLDRENQNNIGTTADRSQSFEPVMTHQNTSDYEIQALQDYRVSDGNGNELLQGQPPGGNVGSSQKNVTNERSVEGHLCLDDDHHVDGSRTNCLKDQGHLSSDVKLEAVIHGVGNEILKGDPSESVMKSVKRRRSSLPKEALINDLGKSRIHTDVNPTNYVQLQSSLEGSGICGNGTEDPPSKRPKNVNFNCEIQHNISSNDKESLSSGLVVSQQNRLDNAIHNKEISLLHVHESKKNVSNETDDRNKGCDKRESSSKNIEHLNKNLSSNSTDAEIIAAKKHRSLNFRSMYDHDSQAVLCENSQRICCKCSEGGKLLTCSINYCQLVVHDSCLGSPASFDDKGNFQCPFCSYERAMTAYLDSKKKAAQARECLARFTGVVKTKSWSISHEPQHKAITYAELPDKNHYNKEQNEIISNQLVQVVEHQKEAEDAGELPQWHLSGTEPETSIVAERNDVVLTGKDPKPVVVQQTTGAEEDQQPTEPVNLCCDDGLPLREGNTFTITEKPSEPVNLCCNDDLPLREDSVASERENANMPEEPRPISQEEEEKKQESSCNEGVSADLRCMRRTVSESDKPAGLGNLNPMLQQQTLDPVLGPSFQPTVTPTETSENGNALQPSSQLIATAKETPKNDNALEPSSQPIVTAKGTSENENDDNSVSSEDSSRSRRPAIRRSFPVLASRRRKVPWTEEEVKILEEGVLKFSGDSRKMPWKIILEFGRHVFQSSRNTVDLKDKWRNICTKRDPKAN